MNDLSNKIILVTGGSGLLGRAIIKNIAERNGIAINLDINCKNDLHNREYYLDITSTDSIKQALDAVLNQYGRIDGLVNNAYPRTKDWGVSFDSETIESWKENVDLQLNSHVNMIKKVGKVMSSQKGGNIVNITSIYGVVGNDQSLYEGTKISAPAAYSAIKGGMINFTRFLAGFYGKHNIKVNCISPGGIFDNQDPKFVKNYESRVPLGRMGTPEDIAPVVSFLLSEDAKYISGQNIIVDGGYTSI